ncbi:MAG: hypothetical protein PVS3B3_13780 [Ktedonobacteraceae bacterium]
MSDTSFQGFDFPNTTPVPDIVFDELLRILTGNELKVLLYIIRRTYGFGKSADAISLSQFREGIKTKEEKILDLGCGLEHNRTILVALAALEKKGYIVSKKRNTTIGDKDTTIYKLRFKGTDKPTSEANPDRGVVTSGNYGVVTPSNHGSLPEVTTGSYSTSLRVVTSGNQQETVIQETVIQEKDTYSEIVANAKSHASLTANSLQEMIALLSQQGYTILPSNPTTQENPASDNDSQSQEVPHRGSEQSQNAHPFVSPPLQSGEIGTPLSLGGGIMTPPTTSVDNTPRRSGEFGQTHIQYGRQVGKNGITSVTFQEMLEAQQKQSHDVATQDSAFLPAYPTENSPTMPIPSNEPPTPTHTVSRGSQREIEPSSSNDASKQATSYSQSGQPQENTPLAAEKPAVPVMPPAEMKWCAEKMVQITEAKRIVRGKVGAYFDEGLPGMGAKSQRQRQLEAAKKIIARGITESQYLLAYDDCNNEWWNTNKGSVTVETMAANTPRKIMRVIELTESLESKSQTIASARMAAHALSHQTPPVDAASMTPSEAEELARTAIEQAKEHGHIIQANAVNSSKKPGTWFVRVKWEDNNVSIIKSAKQWKTDFSAIHEILQMKANMKQGVR